MIAIKLQTIDAKKIAGMSILTSPAKSQAPIIWRKFMPRRGELKGPENDVYYSIQDYPNTYSFASFDPQAEFTTWAAKEVDDHHNFPQDIETTLIKGGLYATWIHHGTVDSFSQNMGHFFISWLPKSGYMLDLSRKHFERLGKDFLGPQNPDSKEEVFIPIIPNTKF